MDKILARSAKKMQKNDLVITNSEIAAEWHPTRKYINFSNIIYVGNFYPFLLTMFILQKAYKVNGLSDVTNQNTANICDYCKQNFFRFV